MMSKSCRLLFASILLITLSAGCTSIHSTDTDRTGMEQLLISNSVDQALNRVDFTAFRGRAVYVEEKYIDSVDKSYVVGSVRARVLSAGAQLVASADKADVVVEVRSGSVGTDRSEMFIGTPAVSVPGPLPIGVPEIQLVSRSSQTGTAKIGLIAYDPQTGRSLGDGGTALARSDDNNWFVFGAGPFQNGTVREEVGGTFNILDPVTKQSESRVAFSETAPYAEQEAGRYRLAGGEEEPPFERPRPDLRYVR